MHSPIAATPTGCVARSAPTCAAAIRATPICRRAAPGFCSRLERTLGFDAAALRHDLVASTRFHRLLRRGREYGTELTRDQALSGATRAATIAVCTSSALNANIGRQFEFVQGAWIAGTRFAGLAGESDPLLGSRLPGPTAAPPTCSRCRKRRPDRRLNGLPQLRHRARRRLFLPARDPCAALDRGSP